MKIYKTKIKIKMIPNKNVTMKTMKRIPLKVLIIKVKIIRKINLTKIINHMKRTKIVIKVNKILFSNW